MPVVWSIAGCGTSGPSSVAPENSKPASNRPVAEAPSAKPASAAAVADPPAATVAADPPAAPGTTGARLYTQYCATCHGENGDGNGLAARFLYPKPRNFRDGHYRLITTANSVPTDDDLMRVIVRGMPGSAMLPVAAHLSEPDRKALVGHVRELTRQGVKDRIIAAAREFGDEVDPDDLNEQVEGRTTPEDVLQTPDDLPTSDAASIARGRAIYVNGCATCHGDTGKGDGVQEQRDEFDFPIRPRDLTRGIFKGGRDTEQLYARLTLGVPGTPMPSSPSLKPSEIGDVINYIQSLSDPSATAKSEHKRLNLVVKRSAATLPDVIPDALWNTLPATNLVVSPLWWRDQADPDLQVKAVHDGESIAIRLTWRDPSQNDQAGGVLDFPDMAAVEFFQGDAEPFLGMGSTVGEVDVWLWNATAQADRKRYSDVDTKYPDMAVDGYPFEKPGDGPRAHPTNRQPREFLTGWAAGNLRSDPTRPSDATSLHARGPGSLTMRPRASQVVKAEGSYQSGGWTVVFRRPLHIAKGDGVSIAPGKTLSAAFALWEGSAHDRNGQKLVSIWHDLTVE